MKEFTIESRWAIAGRHWSHVVGISLNGGASLIAEHLNRLLVVRYHHIHELAIELGASQKIQAIDVFPGIGSQCFGLRNGVVSHQVGEIYKGA